MSYRDHEECMNSQLEFGWRVHTAQEAWTAKVDVKASILLAAQVGLLVAIATIESATGFKHPNAPWWGLLPIGVILILLGGVASASAIYPQLSSSKGEASDLIYFGHLKDLKPEEVRERLEGLNEVGQLVALSRQLVQMSKNNWLKHVRLQWSIRLTGAGLFPAVVGIVLAF